MKKRICALCLCIIFVCSFISVSAAELPVVIEAGGIEMSSVTYEDEALTAGADITVKITAKRTEAAEGADKVILAASLYDGGVMIGMDTDSKELGTEETEFAATLTLPEDVSNCEITAALLKQTASGLVPISSSSYRPGSAEFLPLRSASLGSGELTFDESGKATYVLAPGSTDYPDNLSVQAADAATKVQWTLVDAEEPVYGLITASLPDGDEIEYTVEFVNATHMFANAKTDDAFTYEGSHSDWNMVSKVDVMNSASDYISANNFNAPYGFSYKDYYMKAFTNLHGTDEENPSMGGSRWFTNYPANSKQRHAINYVDPLYEGCDYFITSNGAMTTDQSVNYMDFDLAYDAEIVILTMSQCTNYPQDGYTESNNKNGFLVGNYLNLTFVNPLFNTFGIVPTQAEAALFDSRAVDKEYGSDEYMAGCEALAEALTERLGKEITAQQLSDAKVAINASTNKAAQCVGNTSKYVYAYTKAFDVPEGETLNIKVKAPDKAQGRGFIVVVKPVVE